MQEFFRDENELLEDILFRDKLSCTIDLATGTGKTWVMYAVARILLAEGVVDNVLVVCPSRTIKYELLKNLAILQSKLICKVLFPRTGNIEIQELFRQIHQLKKAIL